MSRSTPSAFTERERDYLESLPAVKRVTATRIYYTDEFRDECVRRNGAGEGPVALFRGAGLDPKLIGYKRIERCFARWRAEQGKGGAPEPAEGDGRMPPAIVRRDRLIASQALRIAELEQCVRDLRAGREA